MLRKLKKSRLEALIQLLSESKEGLLIKDLASIFNLSTKTIKRDVSELRDNRVPIVDIRTGANKHSRFKIQIDSG